jgi:RimJ/RimL family protein N-acetyltransferase
MRKPWLHMRKVTMEDARMLFNWRNDWETRKHSRNPGPVTWDEHCAWLRDRIEDAAVPHRMLRVFEDNGGSLVGVVRADEREGGAYELSYTVAPDRRGRGLGRLMVLQFAGEAAPGRRFVAIIEKGHRPSEQIARALRLRPAAASASEPGVEAGPIFVEWS